MTPQMTPQLNVRWRKVLRDIQAARGRMAMIIAAIAVSLVAVVAMLTTWTVLLREVPRSYNASNPASARLALDGEATPQLLAAVRAQPGIALASASASMSAQIVLKGGEALPVILFVRPDFASGGIDALYTDEGLLQPPAGSVVIERSAMALTQARVGGVITLQLPTGGRRSVTIAAAVHDPGVAPAWQEQVIYAYVTQETLRAFGEPIVLDQLKLLVRDTAATESVIDSLANGVAAWLPSQGRRVWSVQVPPPHRHPHQSQMNAIVTMLLIFSLLGMVLGVALSTTVISGLLAQQVRQIAIMKAIGARSRQLSMMYLSLVAGLGAVAVLVAVPIGVLAGRRLVASVGVLLNLRIDSVATPWWLPVVALALGVLAPMLAAAWPIRRAVRRTVRAAMDDHGGSTAHATGALMRWAATIHLHDAAVTMAARNAFRRRSRLVVTAGLLAGAGAMFIASVDLMSAWQRRVRDALASRTFDTELRLQDPAPTAALLRVVARVPDVDVPESWNVAGAMHVDAVDTTSVGRVYADGGHGALSFRSAPPSTSLIPHRITDGRWLTPADTGAAVINSMARTLMFAGSRPGDMVFLRVNGHDTPFRLIGVMDEPLTQSTVYVVPATYAERTGNADLTNSLRIRMRDRNGDAVLQASRRVIAALDSAGIRVRRVLTSTRMAAAQSGHVYILVGALGAIAIVMAIVGLIGLASALGISVLERTREFGVMRALGATRRIVLRVVLVEGLVLAAISIGPAVILSRVVSLTVGSVLASIAEQELRLSLSLPGVLLWSAAVLCGAAVVSAIPAARAADMTVRESIAHT